MPGSFHSPGWDYTFRPDDPHYPVTLFDRFAQVAAAVSEVVSRHPEAVVLPFECPIRGYVSWAVARCEDGRWVIDWWGLRHRAADVTVMKEMGSREQRGNLAVQMIHQGVRLLEAREATAGRR